MDVQAARENERWKGIANFCDNSALAFLVASVANGFGDGGPDLWSVAGVLLGLAFLWAAWHIRGLIQSED